MSIDLREEPVAFNGSGQSRVLRLTVHDNGGGFDPGASLGIGMTAMRERVGGLGGSANIESARGGGTTVSVVVPLPAGKGAHRPREELIEGHMQ